MIVFSESQLTAISNHAASTYPEECCGLIAGWDDGETTWVTSIQPSPNVSTQDRRRHFEIDPQVRFDVMRELDGSSNRIIGHYHSHPNEAAVPSERDLSMAFEPEMIWIVIGVTEDQVTEMRAYCVQDDASGFVEIPLLSDPETA